MVEYDTNGGFSVDTFVRRLERVGCNVSKSEFHPQIDIYTVNFYMNGAEGDELFPSSVELSKSGEVEMVQIRLPTFTAEPEGDGMDYEEYEAKRRSAVTDIWDRIRDSVGDIISRELQADFRYGVIQDDGMTMRAQHGNEMKNVTPHIEFLRMADGKAPIDRNELVRIVKEINEVWEKEFFDVKTVSRSDL